ncbi:hypothetical protein DIPPA_31339 [Diplonema papillatum]|nr:hypothetical protein DIPPA_31339 [Diplonema papillatum]
MADRPEEEHPKEGWASHGARRNSAAQRQMMILSNVQFASSISDSMPHVSCGPSVYNGGGNPADYRNPDMLLSNVALDVSLNNPTLPPTSVYNGRSALRDSRTPEMYEEPQNDQTLHNSGGDCQNPQQFEIPSNDPHQPPTSMYNAWGDSTGHRNPDVFEAPLNATTLHNSGGDYPEMCETPLYDPNLPPASMYNAWGDSTGHRNPDMFDSPLNATALHNSGGDYPEMCETPLYDPNLPPASMYTKGAGPAEYCNPELFLSNVALEVSLNNPTLPPATTSRWTSP